MVYVAVEYAASPTMLAAPSARSLLLPATSTSLQSNGTICGHARVTIAAWAKDYNEELPHSALGYETSATFASELNRKWPDQLRL